MGEVDGAELPQMRFRRQELTPVMFRQNFSSHANDCADKHPFL